MPTNRNSPRGLRPLKNPYGTIPKVGTYQIASGQTLYHGDVVLINASGLVTIYTTTGCLTGQVLGVMGNYAIQSNANLRECKVFDDPNQLFEVQADDATLTNRALANGALFRLAIATGNTTTLNSKHQLDGNTGTSVTGSGAATVRTVRCEGLVQRIGNDHLLSFAKFAVRFIPSVHHYGMAAVGVLGTRYRGV